MLPWQIIWSADNPVERLNVHLWLLVERFVPITVIRVQNGSIDSAREILNTELAKAALWFDSNKPPLNVNKTQMIMLSCKKIPTPQNEVFLRNDVVQRVNKAKFLGVIVDQHLNWNDHISKKIQVMRHNISNS